MYDDYEDHFDNDSPEPEPEGRVDPYVERAKREIEELFEEDTHLVVYARQLEVRLERTYFHWITARAADDLVDEGTIKREQRPLRGGGNASFLFHPSLRYRRRIINRKLKVLEEYAESSRTVRIGEWAEILFLVGFSQHGFPCAARKVRAYAGKEWTATGHDLDFVLHGNGGPWGCEVKNTMDYIDRAELQIKLQMCHFLALRPLFILRHAPKTYIELVRQAGGFTLIFDVQAWPFGQEHLIAKLREELGLPLDCPRAIPSGIFHRFNKWLTKAAPPQR